MLLISLCIYFFLSQAEALFSKGCDRASGKDKRAQDRRGVEVLRDSKEVQKDYGRP